MKTTILSLLAIAFITILSFSTFTGCNPTECDNCEPDTGMVVYKPNIYLYPEQSTNLQVSLEFPKGGKVIESNPAYNSFWNITVEPNGTIDNKYSYLFYESIQPDEWQRNEAWVIEVKNAETFFRDNLTEYGFNTNEVNDFIEYWIPYFQDQNWLTVFPQTQKEIKPLIKLTISEQPQNLLRLFYLIKPSFKRPVTKYNVPTVNSSFTREGFHVAEWGVILDEK